MKKMRPFKLNSLKALLAGALLLTASPLAAQSPPQGLADYVAGLAYEYKADGSSEPALAAQYYEKAAAAGSREALLALARLAGPGEALWQGPDHWRDRLLAASRAGWPEAAFRLAEALEKGQIKDSGSAYAAFYLQAAAAGHGPAALRLGNLYLTGQGGLPRDEEQAALWLALAAANHMDEAALTLGKFFYEANPAIALRWLERAPALPEAGYLLGQLYLKERRIVEAQGALTSSADQGYPEAHLTLGLMNLDNDFGLRPNPREALRHFKVAAQARLPEGAYQLAHMYLKGLATPKDSITAAFWLHQAASEKHPTAAEEFNKLTYNFTSGQKKRLERMIADGVTPTMQLPPS